MQVRVERVAPNALLARHGLDGGGVGFVHGESLAEPISALRATRSTFQSLPANGDFTLPDTARR